MKRCKYNIDKSKDLFEPFWCLIDIIFTYTTTTINVTAYIFVRDDYIPNEAWKRYFLLRACVFVRDYTDHISSIRAKRTFCAYITFGSRQTICWWVCVYSRYGFSNIQNWIAARIEGHNHKYMRLPQMGCIHKWIYAFKPPILILYLTCNYLMMLNNRSGYKSMLFTTLQTYSKQTLTYCITNTRVHGSCHFTNDFAYYWYKILRKKVYTLPQTPNKG